MAGVHRLGAAEGTAHTPLADARGPVYFWLGSGPVQILLVEPGVFGVQGDVGVAVDDAGDEVVAVQVDDARAGRIRR